jgi:hypothetical protein
MKKKFYTSIVLLAIFFTVANAFTTPPNGGPQWKYFVYFLAEDVTDFKLPGHYNDPYNYLEESFDDVPSPCGYGGELICAVRFLVVPEESYYLTLSAINTTLEIIEISDPGYLPILLKDE